MTGAALQLPPFAATRGVVLAAPHTNTAEVAVGPAGVTASTGLTLDPGQMTPTLALTNASDLFAIGTAPDLLTFLVT